MDLVDRVELKGMIHLEIMIRFPINGSRSYFERPTRLVGLRANPSLTYRSTRHRWSPHHRNPRRLVIESHPKVLSCPPPPARVYRHYRPWPDRPRIRSSQISPLPSSTISFDRLLLFYDWWLSFWCRVEFDSMDRWLFVSMFYISSVLIISTHPRSPRICKFIWDSPYIGLYQSPNPRFSSIVHVGFFFFFFWNYSLILQWAFPTPMELAS